MLSFSLLGSQVGIARANSTIPVLKNQSNLVVLAAAGSSSTGQIHGLLFQYGGVQGRHSSVFFPLPAAPRVVCSDENPPVESDPTDEGSQDGEETPPEDTSEAEAETITSEPSPEVEPAQPSELSTAEASDANRDEAADLESPVEVSPTEETDITGREETVTTDAVPSESAVVVSQEAAPSADVVPSVEANSTPQDVSIVASQDPAVVPITDPGASSETPQESDIEETISSESVIPAPVKTIAATEVLLKFKSDLTTEEKEQIVASFGGNVSGNNTSLNYQTIQVAAGTEQTIIDLLTGQGVLEWGQTNNICQVLDSEEIEADYTPNETLDAIARSALTKTNAYAGWDITTGSNTVTIAILDSGIQTTNADFAGRLVTGYNGFDGTSNVEDVYGHGTHVAGIAAATGNNLYGIAGINWQANIMPVKVLNDTGIGSSNSVADGITWAVDHGANVINMSLGSSSVQKPIEDAVKYAHDHGVVVVASAGNDYDTRYNYPASYDNVISVGAVTSSNTIANFSNVNDKVDVVAPGVNIVSDALTGITRMMTGTSQASPFVAGLASLLFGVDKFNKNPDAIEEAIENSATDLGAAGRDNFYGYGMINIAAALNYIFATEVPTFTPPTEVTPVPTQPTAEPTQPTVEPTQPTIEPTQPTIAPTQPTVDLIPTDTPKKVTTPKPPLLFDIKPVFPPGRIDMTAPGLVYTGGWNLIPSSESTVPPTLFTNTVGSTAGMRFSGSSVRFTYPTNANFGRVRIMIDGVDVAILDLSSTGSQTQNIWQSLQLPDGEHSITITLLDGSAMIDGFIVE